MACEHFYFSGHVQGVGFRYTAARIARNCGLVGWVKNLPDGRVESVVDGSPEMIEVFLKDLRAHFQEKISTIQRRTRDGASEYHQFDIRF